MITKQRLRNDIATIDKREITDKTLSDSRNKNDEITLNRRHKKDKGAIAGKTLIDSRNKNDELTAMNRFKADKITFENRGRNDLLTADRREIKDENRAWILALSLVLVALAVGISSILI